MEARNPDVTKNDDNHWRTDPCIALYQTTNASGSWKMLNMRTMSRVSRSQYVRMVHTPPLVVDAMNKLASKGSIDVSDIIDDNVPPVGVECDAPLVIDHEADELEVPTGTHVPDPNMVEIIGAAAAVDDDERVDQLESRGVRLRRLM